MSDSPSYVAEMAAPLARMRLSCSYSDGGLEVAETFERFKTMNISATEAASCSTL